MAIIYTCRHCQQTIGHLKQQTIPFELLGLDQLSVEERKKIVHYDSDGKLTIYVICESCEQSLTDHPKYHELDFFIH